MTGKDVLLLLSHIKTHGDKWEIKSFLRLTQRMLEASPPDTRDIIEKLIYHGKLNTVACAMDNYISRTTVYRRIEAFCRLVIHSAILDGSEKIYKRCADSIRRESLRGK